MKIRKFNESKEIIDFNLLDKYITYIRECLLDFEDDERIKYLMHRVHFMPGSATGQKRGQQFGDYFTLSNYDVWLSNVKKDLDKISNQEWFIRQMTDNKPTHLLQCIIDIPTIVQYPTEIKDISDIESVMNSVEKLKWEFDDVSVFFNSDEVGRYGIPKQKAIIGVYFNLKS